MTKTKADQTHVEVSTARFVQGKIRVPGDKSVGHRALLFSGLADGTSRIEGLPHGADVQTTRRVLQALGIDVVDEGATTVVHGKGWAGLDDSSSAGDEPITLDCGNSGTTARLLSGVVAARNGRYRLVGDDSLSSRPMDRVVDPLRAMGASIEGSKLPLTIEGGTLGAAKMQTPVASAQVKSCLILAALQAAGESVISEITPTRDHTERMLGEMGAPIERLDPLTVLVRGGSQPLTARNVQVPGDPSSAAFWAGLACATRDGEVTIENVMLNTRRTGFVRILERMGANILTSRTSDGIEPIGTITARGSDLHAIEIGPSDVVDAIDELPLIAVVATQAHGQTIIRGAGELRVKETDRIAATADLLREFGAEVELLEDGMIVSGPTNLRGATVVVPHDHRIAMCAAVAGSLADGSTAIHGAGWADVSYPGFYDQLRELTSN